MPSEGKGHTFESCRARQFLGRHGLLPEDLARNAQFKPVPGHSNVVFQVATPSGVLACRLPRLRLPPDRVQSEHLATQDAWRLGIGAKVAAWDDESAGLATHWIDGAVAGSARSFRRNGARVADAFRLLARFHAGAGPLPARFDPAEAVREGLATAEHTDPKSVPGDRLEEALGKAARLLQDCGNPVPSHGDPSPQNFLIANGHLHLIDWEYAAMAPPLWDFCYLAFEIGMTPQQVIRRLQEMDAGIAGDVPHVTASMLQAGILIALWFDGAPGLRVQQRNRTRWQQVDRLAAGLRDQR